MVADGSSLKSSQGMTVVHCSAQEGAIFAREGRQLRLLSRVLFRENQAIIRCGAPVADGSLISFSAIAEAHNCSAMEGGVIYANNGSQFLFLANLLFKGNQAITRGGALAVDGSSLDSSINGSGMVVP